MACLITKGWVIYEGKMFTGVQADILEYVIDWLNGEPINIIKDSWAIVRLSIEFEAVSCDVLIYPPEKDGNKNKEIIYKKKFFMLFKYVDELKLLIGEKKVISEYLRNI